MSSIDAVANSRFRPRMDISQRLRALFSLSSYPPWLTWLPGESARLGAAFLLWRKLLVSALLLLSALLAALALLARYASSPELRQLAFAVVIVAIWPLFLLPVSVWSGRLASIAFAVLRARPSSDRPRSSFVRLRLWGFSLLALGIAVIGAASAVPWFLLVRQLVSFWLTRSGG